jgi:hypothetical protein
MATSLNDVISFIEDFASTHPGCTKETVSKATAEHFSLKKQKSIYTCSSFSIRFSTAKKASFSNVVLALSALQKHDHLPFIVCVVRPTGVELLLANSTFLKKISHSSQQLRTHNVRGSFLGHDILRDYEGTANVSSNFAALFAAHSEFTWQENLARLVKETNNISPTGVRFEPSPAEYETILSAADFSAQLSSHAEYIALGTRLAEIVERRKESILAAAEIDNVNERGNTIEQLITEGANVHGVEDLKFVLRVGTVFVDVKTKLLALSSSPKGYNIDKVLITLAQGRTVFSFLFVGIDQRTRSLFTRLVSILDRRILAATRIQFHWAGRNSRGVTQLTGDLSSFFDPAFVEFVEVVQARAFLRQLIDLKKPG